jgi:predicted ATPase
VILTPDQRLRIFISSTLGELAPEREAVSRAVESLGLTPVMFELGARPHPPRELYRSYLQQSQVFVGIYWQRYGWIAPDMEISGLHDEYLLGKGLPRLLYLKEPSPDREPGLARLVEEIEAEAGASYKPFRGVAELEELVRGDLALLLSERFRATDDGFPPAPRTRSVPVPVTPLIGRAAEIETLLAMVTDPDVRLVTLTGPGGVGKTRVALEVAGRAAKLGDGEVVFAPLEAIDDPGGVLPAIVRAFGLQPTGGESPLAAITDLVAERRTLLVLDNFEQVLDAGPEVAELLASCPGLTALVTSRAVLHVRGERDFPIAPLAAPPGARGEEPLRQYDAVRLFIDRAKAARDDLNVDEESAPAIAELCHRLDGLPLAIELAAARSRLFSPEELLRRMEEGGELLAGGHRDLPERQRTLRGTLRWSYDLLSPEEQLVFTRLGVFAGGFALEAAERVCAGGGVDVVQAISSLIDKSLVRPVPAASRPGLGMLRTVRDFAAELLEGSGEAQALRREHARYFLDLAGSAHAGLRSSDQALWCGRLDAERRELLAAFDWATANEPPERPVAALWAVWPFWWISGPADEGMGVARALAGREDLSERDAAYAQAVRGLLGYWLADYGHALPDVSTALESLQQMGEKEGMAACLVILGSVQAFAEGDSEGQQMLRRALELSEEVGDRWGAALMGNVLARALTLNGSGSEEVCREALARAEEVGSPQEVSMALANLGRFHVYEGEGARALPYLSRALELLRPLRNRVGAASILQLVAEAVRDQPARAAALLARAAALREAANAPAHGRQHERVEWLREALRAELGSEEFGRAWEGAFDPSFEGAVAAGLDAVSAVAR